MLCYLYLYSPFILSFLVVCFIESLKSSNTILPKIKIQLHIDVTEAKCKLKSIEWNTDIVIAIHSYIVSIYTSVTYVIHSISDQ